MEVTNVHVNHRLDLSPVQRDQLAQRDTPSVMVLFVSPSRPFLHVPHRRRKRLLVPFYITRHHVRVRQVEEVFLEEEEKVVVFVCLVVRVKILADVVVQC